MKKLLTLVAVMGMLSFGASNFLINSANAQEPTQVQEASNQNIVDDSTATQEAAPAPVQEEAPAEAPEEAGFHQALKTKFIEGGAGFMATVLLCLIFGLAIAIERIIYLNMSSTNTSKLLKKVEDAINEGGVESAKEVCRNTRGPVASIFYQGLDRYDQGLDVVEKSVISYGSVQMGLLERGLSWITLFIALAPMLGFLGTVIGMIQAFDSIQAAGDVSPTLVAGGIKVALITTVGGLIVAMILQLFYNYLVSKVDSITGQMEDASISLMDVLVKFNRK